MSFYPGAPSSPLCGDLHCEVEEVRVPVLHAVLGEQQCDHLTAGGAAGHADGLVLDVRTQALGVHLDGRL